MQDRLIKFARVVEAGSLTKAAVLLHISQPALSMAINSLERELGTSLLIRTTRPLQLTAAGTITYAAAKDMSATSANLRLQLAELSDSKLSATIGMTDSVAQGLLQTDAMLQEIEAWAHVSLVVHNSRFLYRAVAHDELDMAFAVAADTLLTTTLESCSVGQEPLVLVGHASQAAFIQAELACGHLSRFICYDQHSISYGLVQAGLERHRIVSRPVFFSTSPEVMLRLVLLKKGVAVLPYLYVAPFLAAGTLQLLARAGSSNPLNIKRPIAQITRRRKRLPASFLQVTGHVSQLLARLNDQVGNGG